MSAYPLRQLLSDAPERFQLGFAEQAALLLEGFSGVATERTARGLLLSALAERDLAAAAAIIQAAFPAAVTGAVEVVLRNEGAAEPYIEVEVVTPKDCYGEVVRELNRRQGSIEGTLDADEELMRVTATAALARMLGFDEELARISRDRAMTEYRFAGYRPIETDPPPLPRAPALRASS